MRKTLSAFLTAAVCISFAGCSQTADGTVSVEIDYDTAVVGYLGPEGTYTQEACGVFFDKKGTYKPYETVNATVEALVSGECGYAVIPQENTIGGAVIDYVDTLTAFENISVVGEVELQIDQNLLVLPGTDLDEITTVYSHKQGIAQGKEWLEQNIPDAEVIEVSSTAEGAKTVAESGVGSCVAIASAACADVYGLEILAFGIQNNDSNRTRFYVLSRQDPATEDNDRLAFIAKGDAEELPKLMSAMEKRNMTLVTIHDRPLKTELGEYYYVIECANCSYSDLKKIMDKSGFEIRYLGSFDAR